MRLQDDFKEIFDTGAKKEIQELKENESIIICPADKGKVVVIENQDKYLTKTQDQKYTREI